uniref:Cytochrome b6-f complex subunit petP n=1 Tax=Eucheuma denticulatum TaxID=305493 RepID=A0A8E7PGJ6_9FLOR|nr:cytochrome b6-f complex subunit petP [Eucheuma denticulatum]
MDVYNSKLKIKKLNKQYNQKLIEYLYKPGTIVGMKIINKRLIVHIIEFDDYTRIWFFQRELKLMKSEKN